MKAIIILAVFVLWSCENPPSNNNHEEINSDPISSIDTVIESPPPVKVQGKTFIESDISDKELIKYTANWAISLRKLIPKETLYIVFRTGQYKAILRTNSYSVSDTTEVPAFFEKVKNKIGRNLPESRFFPQNIVHQWYEDSTTTDQKNYLLFEADIEQAMLEIQKQHQN